MRASCRKSASRSVFLVSWVMSPSDTNNNREAVTLGAGGRISKAALEIRPQTLKLPLKQSLTGGRKSPTAGALALWIDGHLIPSGPEADSMPSATRAHI